MRWTGKRKRPWPSRIRERPSRCSRRCSANSTPRAQRPSRKRQPSHGPDSAPQALRGPCSLLLRLPAVLPVRRALCGARGAGVAADLHRRVGTRLCVRAARLARARDALWLRAGGRYGFPADRHSELDRPAAAARHAADRAAAGLDRGPRSGDAVGHHRLVPGCADRWCIPAAGRRRRRARDRRGRQLAQSEGRLADRAAGAGQRRASTSKRISRARPTTASASASRLS